MTIRLKFINKQGLWYYDLPAYAKAKGLPPAPIPVTRYGVDTFLELVGTSEREVVLEISDEPGSNDEIVLEKIEESDIGAHYLLQEYQQEPYVLQVHLAEPTIFMFGYLPNFLYIRKLPGTNEKKGRSKSKK